MTQSEIELQAWESWIYPSEFWDGLSKISLTYEALEELTRRIRLQHHPSPPPPQPGQEQAEDLAHALPVQDVARFARHGGPDLSDLRGYAHLAINLQPSVAMGASLSSQSWTRSSIDPASIPLASASTKTIKTKRSTPYNRNFDQHLTDHDVHPVYSSQRPNLTGVQEALTAARPSLSLSRFSEDAFETFQESNARARDEDDVLAYVIPTIVGPHPPACATARNTIFGNLAPLTDGTIAPPKPDAYDGAHPQELSRLVRDELGHHVMPSTMQDKPVAPNFFLEVKGPYGISAVAVQQARYDGATGARAMHSLQNYEEEEPRYDGQAYSFSCTYQEGQLKLYAHHLTAPTGEGGQPEYHMTQLRAFAMTDTRETFLQGATAFRNARDMARRHRDSLVRAANARATRPRTSAPQDIVATRRSGDPATGHAGRRDGEEEPRQHAAGANRHDLGHDGGAAATPPSLCIDGGPGRPSRDAVALGDDPSLGTAPGFTSSLRRAKRPRESPSPPSTPGGSWSYKSRKRPRIQRTEEPPPPPQSQRSWGSSEVQEDSRWRPRGLQIKRAGEEWEGDREPG